MFVLNVLAFCSCGNSPSNQSVSKLVNKVNEQCENQDTTKESTSESMDTVALIVKTIIPQFRQASRYVNMLDNGNGLYVEKYIRNVRQGYLFTSDGSFISDSGILFIDAKVKRILTLEEGCVLEAGDDDHWLRSRMLFCTAINDDLYNLSEGDEVCVAAIPLRMNEARQMVFDVALVGSSFYSLAKQLKNLIMISRSLIGETDEEKMKNLFLRILPYFYVKHHSYDIDVNPAKNASLWMRNYWDLITSPWQINEWSEEAGI